MNTSTNSEALPFTADFPSTIMEEIVAEVARATAKFPTWPTDPLHAFAIVGEEFGEAQKDLLQLIYEPHKSSREELRKEAIQLAAMSLRFLISFDRYEFTPGIQHSQNPPRAMADRITGPPCPKCSGNYTIGDDTGVICFDCNHSFIYEDEFPENANIQP